MPEERPPQSRLNWTWILFYLAIALFFGSINLGWHHETAVQARMCAGSHCSVLSLLRHAPRSLLLCTFYAMVAGDPRATLVVLIAVAASFQIRASAVLMLLGVDTLMDMGRTRLNVIGNCMAAAVVARWEGVLELPTVHNSKH